MTHPTRIILSTAPGRAIASSAAGSEHRRASSPADLAATSGGTKRVRSLPSSESVARARASPPAESVAVCTLRQRRGVLPHETDRKRDIPKERIRTDWWVKRLVGRCGVLLVAIDGDSFATTGRERLVKIKPGIAYFPAQGISGLGSHTKNKPKMILFQDPPSWSNCCRPLAPGVMEAGVG